VTHDRIHAREPAHDRERFTEGTIEAVGERDGHCVVAVTPADGAGIAGDAATVELVVTFAIRDLFLSRLDVEDGESPVGERVWYRRHGA